MRLIKLCMAVEIYSKFKNANGGKPCIITFVELILQLIIFAYLVLMNNDVILTYFAFSNGVQRIGFPRYWSNSSHK